MSVQKRLRSTTTGIERPQARAVKLEASCWPVPHHAGLTSDFSREDYFKALTESQYLQQRARLVETIYTWWSDVLRAKNDIERSELPAARKHTAALAAQLTTPEILRRIRRIEELRDHLSRNIQEALAVEVAFLALYAR